MASESMESFDSPGDAAYGNRRPASILLDRKAHATGFRIDHPPDIADNSNETTATAKSMGGHTMAVSFWAADPPDLSFFSVICTKPPYAVSKTAYFKGSPYVVGGEGRFVLLRARFMSPRHDSDLIRLLDKPKPRHGWRAVTWSRRCKEHDVDVADILDDESAADSSLLYGLRGEDETVGKLKFRDLFSVFPTLSIDNGDIVYLISAAESSDQNGWVVTVDLGNKTVKALGAYPFKNPTKQAFRTSTLSRHLVITPVSVYHKITQVAKSANKPNNALIHVDKSVKWKFKSEIKRMLEDFEKHKRIRDEPRTSIQNDQSRMKQQRLSAEETTLAPNKAQSIVHNDHISQIHPVQNNLPPQHFFNPDQPCHLGYSSYPEQNNLQQCFSMMNGFCGYAPLAPTPVLHGYGNYQPLWHQPSQWNLQQQQPSSEFELHKASQPCFNKHNGASSHGYLQQLSAHNSSQACFSKHNGASFHGYVQKLSAHNSVAYGNNQQQWQPHTRIHNLPASGSWQQPRAVQHQLRPSGV